LLFQQTQPYVNDDFLNKILYKVIVNHLWNWTYLTSNDDDFIGLGLGEMGYSCRSYKKTISNSKFIRGRFQIEIL
jgi:hypothetical protein